MIDKIIAFSIKNKVIVGMMTVALIIWGIWSAGRLPIDAVPDITNNQVQIITVCPTLASQEVEQLVSYPIEQSIANLPDLVELRSISRFGLSVVTVVFDDEVDIYFARQLINERLKKAETVIPKGLGTPELAPVSTGLGEIYQYIIHPKKESKEKYTAMDLRTMQDWIVARQLIGTPGIAEVNSFGGLLKQYEVAVNPNKLLAMNVTIPEIFTALEKNNENTGGAYIDKKPNAYFIRGVGLLTSLEDIKQIVVKLNPNGIPIQIKDLAEVGYGHAVRYGAMTYNGEKDVVGGIIMMLAGENSAEVIQRIREKIPVIQKALPDDIIIEPFLDRRDLVDRAMSTVETNLIEGALIVIFVLVLFLGSFRAGLIVASAIPLSMLFALGLMNVFDVSANLMSLGAIDFGLIVDGAVIIVEATLHHLGLRANNLRLTQKEMDHEVYQSASKIRSSAAFGEIIILIVYIPILSLIGIEGKMFRPMAETVGFAIIGALLLSLTYIPMMCALFLSKTRKTSENFSSRMMNFFTKLYQPMLEKAFRLKKIVLIGSLILFGFSIWVFSRMGGEFIPSLQEGDYAFHCILPQGTSLSQSIETSMQASRLIKQFDEVKMVVGKTGSAEVPTDPMPPEATDLMIILKPKKEWKRKISYEALGDEFMKKLERIPGAFFENNQPIQMRFNELMTGIRQDVAVKIFGENMDTLLKIAQRVSKVIQAVEGSSETMVEKVEGLPQITVRYNRSQIANYGLNIADVNRVISTAFAGSKAGVVFENERKFDLVLRLDSAYKKDLVDLQQLTIPVSQGLQIPLSQVASVQMETGPAQVSREGGKRRIVVGFNIQGRDVSSVVKDIQEKLDREIDLPEAYYFAYGGTFEHLQAASRRLALAVPLALGLIFLLLLLTFQSMKQALLIFTAIPMAAIGGVFTLALRGMPFSISAGIGFIALFGVAVLNGIVLISTFNQLKKEGVDEVMERIRAACRMRLRPVLMTALVASLGFLPMALSTGAGAEVQKPLATVVIGGLISATLLTLFVLPILYYFSQKTFFVKPLAVLALFILPFGLRAQEIKTLSLDDAIRFALAHNLQQEANQYHVQSAAEMKKSVFILPQAELNFQYGQYNSIHQDLGFQINQSIPFPTFFSAKNQLLKAEQTGMQLKKEAEENRLKWQVKWLYYHLLHLHYMDIEYRLQDSLNSAFMQTSALRFQTGAAGLLEKTSAEVRASETRVKLEKNQSEIRNYTRAFKQVLNYQDSFQVQFPDVYTGLQISQVLDSSLLDENPELRRLFQEARIAESEKKVESAQIWPQLHIGYFNQSLIGFQNINSTETYFDGRKRFQGINFGISLPLTFFSQTQKVEALHLKQEAVLKEAEQGRQELLIEVQNAFEQYKQTLSEKQTYESKALTLAETLVSTSQIAYAQGEIAYQEHLLALQTASQIRQSYYESIRELNFRVIQLQYLFNQ